MANKQTVLTQEGLEKLENELEYLKSDKRRDISEKIKIAVSFGDLSENSEYDEAKNEQAMVEARISEIESTLANVRILDFANLNTNVVNIGNKIKVLNLKTNKDMDLTIVGSKEVNFKENKISDESPIGIACVGHKLGDTVMVNAPTGEYQMRILEISK